MIIVSTCPDTGSCTQSPGILGQNASSRTVFFFQAYVTVRVQTGASLIFGGTDEPAAQCDLFCIGVLSQAVNHKYSAGLAPLLEVCQMWTILARLLPLLTTVGYNGWKIDYCGWRSDSVLLS